MFLNFVIIISFEINNGSVSKQLFSLDEPNEDIYISFLSDNLLLGKKELIINEDGFKRSFKFTLLNDISPKLIQRPWESPLI